MPHTTTRHLTGRLPRAFAMVAAAAAVMWVPHGLAAGRVSDVTAALEFIIAVMAVNLVLGYMGQVSFGHSAFVGIGAYTTAILVTRYAWSPALAIVPAILIAFVAGVAVGYPALRLRGLYFALVTFAVAVLFPQLIKWPKLEELTGGARGIANVTYEMPSIPLLGDSAGREGRAVFAYWVTVVAVVACFLVCRGIVESRIGRSLVALRDNEVAAAAMGVNLALTKTIVFGISASLCAVAGSLTALRTSYVSTEVTSMTVIGSVTFVLVMTLGGAGTLWGPVVGGVLFATFDLWMQDMAVSGPPAFQSAFGWMDTSPAVLIVSIALVVMMFVAPSGLVGLARSKFLDISRERKEA